MVLWLYTGVVLKTREKILQTSLLLFNDEGESHVTTVDIANEMDISPGNLYYHFKGKEVIIEELFRRFDVEMTDILAQSSIDSLQVEDYWFYLFVIFEEIYKYRFLYHNINDIMRTYERIQRPFSRILKAKSATARALIEHMMRQDVLLLNSKEELEMLIQQLVMTIIYWVDYNQLIYANVKNTRDNAHAIQMHEGVFQVMTLIGPHLAQHQHEFFNECKALLQRSIDKLGA